VKFSGSPDTGASSFKMYPAPRQDGNAGADPDNGEEFCTTLFA